MAKYFIDFEFIEGFHKPLFGKRRHFIDMISVGIACEDGRNYTAISNDWKYDDADDWVKDNVIIPLYTSTVFGDMRNRHDASNFHKFYGLTNKMIAEDIKKFCSYPIDKDNKDGSHTVTIQGYPEFYGYYSDYDWVLFCSLFGRMIDLPNGFPMYCKDLKQSLDEKASFYAENSIPLKSFEDCLNNLKNRNDYPKQLNEHNALSDAKWNKELYNFIQTL